jgi:hypothetical protein
VKKCKGYLTMMHRVTNTITQRDKDIHVKQRALLSKGFSDATLRLFSETIDFYTQQLLQHLDDHQNQLSRDWSSPKDLSRLGKLSYHESKRLGKKLIVQ